MKTSVQTIYRFPQKLLSPLLSIATKKKSISGLEAPAYSNRQIRIAVSAFFFGQGLCFASWASRIPDIKTSLAINDATLGSILFALPAGQLTAMPFSGRLVTKYGSKKIVTIFLALYAICMANIGLVTQPWHLVLALYFFGICGNMCNISVNTQAIGAEQLYTKPIMTTFHGVWSTAGFTGAVIGLLIIALGLSPLIHFWIVAGLIFLLILIAQKYLLSGTGPATESRKFFSKPDKLLVLLGIIGFCSMASEGAMFEWSGLYFKDVVKAKASLIPLGFASFMIMMATGRFFGDKIIEKIGRKKIMQFGGVLISTGLFISVLFPYLITSVIGFMVVGIGVSSIVPTVYSTAGKVSKLSPGMALAAVSSISFLGFLMGPPLIGYIANLASLRYSYAVIGIFGICIPFLVSKLKVNV